MRYNRDSVDHAVHRSQADFPRSNGDIRCHHQLRYSPLVIARAFEMNWDAELFCLFS